MIVNVLRITDLRQQNIVINRLRILLNFQAELGYVNSGLSGQFCRFKDYLQVWLESYDKNRLQLQRVRNCLYDVQEVCIGQNCHIVCKQYAQPTQITKLNIKTQTLQN